MASWSGGLLARFRRRPDSSVGAIHADVTVGGDVSGQLAVGSHIVQMRVNTVLGNLVMPLPRNAKVNVAAQTGPVRLRPRRPALMLDRQGETSRVLSALYQHQPVDVRAPAGMGKSTLLRFLAYHPPVDDVCGGVAHLGARGFSRDDLLQWLFEVFYTSDVPVKPSRGRLQHYLQHVHATILLDDLELTAEEVASLGDYAPECTFVTAARSTEGAVNPHCIRLAGLPRADAVALLAHGLGRALQSDEEAAIDSLYDVVQGVPGTLVRLAAAARDFAGSLGEFAASVLASGLPPLRREAPEDLRLLGLLAVVPGIQLDVGQLTDITGSADVRARMDELVARGLVLSMEPASGDGASAGYCLAADVDLGPADDWQLETSRTELRDYFMRQSASRRDIVLAHDAPVETVRDLQADAVRRRDWRYVLALGVLLDAAYALSGRWDAWRNVLEYMLMAAQAVGDHTAEALARHQLGTRALCIGDTATAASFLTHALNMRIDAGDLAGAEVTRHNLSLVALPPLPPTDSGGGAVVADDRGSVGALLAKIPRAGKGLLVAAPLVAALTFAGLQVVDQPRVELSQAAMQFPATAINLATQSQSLTARNLGQVPIHVDSFTTSGPHATEFQVIETTCLDREILGGQSCSADVVFTPTVSGSRRASLALDVRESGTDPTVELSGSSPGADQGLVAAVPTQLTFGELPVNQRGERRQIRINGPPGTPVALGAAAIAGMGATDYTIDVDSCVDVVLASGTSCTTGIRFSPSVEGTRDALFTLSSADGKAAVAVPISGTGAAPPETGVEAQPGLLGFGEQPKGTASPPKEVTFRNSSETSHDLANAAIVGGSDFAVVGTTCRATLDAAEECTATLIFAPQATGPRTAQLILGGASGPVVALRGAGVDPPTRSPDIAPGRVSFGEQPIGTTSRSRPVTVTNPAASPLQIRPGSVRSTLPDFRIADSGCSDMIPPGARCTVDVSFTPTAAGPRSGNLLLDAPELPTSAAVALSGIGTDPRTPLVPNVISLPVEDARNVLVGAALVPGSVKQVVDADMPKGHVVDQAPRPGVPADVGGAVDLTISTGPSRVRVPELVGLEQAIAEGRLRGGELRVGTISERRDRTVEQGLVVESTPTSGTEVLVGSAVNLVISQGPPVVEQPPCDVQGQIRDEAGTCRWPPCEVKGQIRDEAGTCRWPPCEVKGQIRDEAGTCVWPPCNGDGCMQPCEVKGQKRNSAGECIGPKPEPKPEPEPEPAPEPETQIGQGRGEPGRGEPAIDVVVAAPRFGDEADPEPGSRVRSTIE
jgi:hypothetical protein